MIAEILATGDEIRSGALVDSNSAYLSEILEENGIHVGRHHCVGDEMPDLVEVIGEISRRADICMVTGGLGPTTDDITAEAVARVAGKELVLHEKALGDIRALFDKLGRPMGDSNEKQAYLPAGSTCMRNPVGTAPGFFISIGKCLFFFMPGVPYEMKKMFSDKVIPELNRLQGDGRQYSLVKTISTFGLPESTVGDKMAPVLDEFPGIKLGLRAKFPEIQVKLYARGNDEKALMMLLEKGETWVVNQLGKYVFSTNGRNMEEEVGLLLKRNGETLALAESCTGGLVAHRMTNVAGSSDYFLFSAVTYSNEAKIKVLGVSPDTIENHGAVHEETVKEMAEGARQLAGTTYGVATSGIAGPGGGSEEKPVGTLCVGLATPKGCSARRLYFPYGKRLMNKRRFAMVAMELLRRELLGIGTEE